ncbi:DUF1003 domain-containing protein [Lignipirellula cremea]|uniref:DUF1003 domain-containing protein n=1 Tax=Lignipirellula cremea TaxID=2528010 RepID=A0A518DL21_9BACT|nr:DUF1003 domain-containing protein [Lignipirellula cremea]QDU92530.1 hypothetical protein Pla8534_02780 [Lignipirellula cremea]
MSKRPAARRRCEICQKEFAIVDVMPAAFVRQAVSDLILEQHPAWSQEAYICFNDLNRYRTLYVEDVLGRERGEVSKLESEVVRSLREQELLAENVAGIMENDRTFGQRLADQIASFGGSWPFLISFGVFLCCWIGLNVRLLFQPFDPFPFILLNLILSCLAAIQAPVIMMSQNRQESKDRIRAEHDYRINLKAELEIRHLHAKLDMLLTHQWQRLLEIQEIQMELMDEFTRHRPQK